MAIIKIMESGLSTRVLNRLIDKFDIGYDTDITLFEGMSMSKLKSSTRGLGMVCIWEIEALCKKNGVTVKP